MVKILALGNEFIQEDSLAKEITNKLKEDFEIINIKDSFQLLDIIKDSPDKEKTVIIDVVENLKEVRFLEIKDLSKNKILTAHDLDASFILQLLNPNIKIIGLPQQGDKQKILEEIKEKLS